MNVVEEMEREADTLMAVLLKIDQQKDRRKRNCEPPRLNGVVDCPRCQTHFIDWSGAARSFRAVCRKPECFSVMS